MTPAQKLKLKGIKEAIFHQARELEDLQGDLTEAIEIENVENAVSRLDDVDDDIKWAIEAEKVT